MGALRFLASGLAVCMVLGSGVVDADELVLPYSCTMDGGVPRLSPSEENTYRIIGSREDLAFPVVLRFGRMDVRNDDDLQIYDQLRRAACGLVQGRGVGAGFGRAFARSSCRPDTLL